MRAVARYPYPRPEQAGRSRTNALRGWPVETEISSRLERAPASVPEARAFLSQLAGAVDPATLETLRLLVGELVTNSVRHGAGEEVIVSVRTTPETVRVEVTDRGPGFSPVRRAKDADAASGWGLYLVAAFSDRWGVKRNGHTQVWFELTDSGAFAHRARLGARPSDEDRHARSVWGE